MARGGTGSVSDVIVIGAGHNGLTAGCYLARSGLSVTVVEAGAEIGGMTTTAAIIPEAPGHLINLCALDAVFIRASSVVKDLGLRRFGYREIEVDPPWIVFDPEGPSLALWRDPRRTAEEIRRFSAADAEAFLRLAREIDAGMGVFEPLALTNPTRPSGRRLAAAARGAVGRPRRLRALSGLLVGSAAEVIDARFSHPLTKSLLGVIAAAGGPITADGSGFNLIAFGFAHRHGVARIAGGTQALPDALARCFASAGGTIRRSAAVEQITVEGERVTGVRLETGEELTARTVITSCDPKQTLTRLLPEGALSDSLRIRAEQIPAEAVTTACFKIDLALSGRVDMSRHEAWRGDGLDLRVPALLDGSFEAACAAPTQATMGRMPDPVLILGAVPTGADPSQAPDGQDTVYLYAYPTPAQPGEPWDVFVKAATAAVLAQVANIYPNIEELEIGRWVETWPELAARTRATGGNPYHVDMGLLRSGPMRPARGFGGYRTVLPGLFLTGAGTHPGPGISAVPGQLAARAVLRSLKSTPARRR